MCGEGVGGGVGWGQVTGNGHFGILWCLNAQEARGSFGKRQLMPLRRAEDGPASRVKQEVVQFMVSRSHTIHRDWQTSWHAGSISTGTFTVKRDEADFFTRDAFLGGCRMDYMFLSHYPFSATTCLMWFRVKNNVFVANIGAWVPWAVEKKKKKWKSQHIHNDLQSVFFGGGGVVVVVYFSCQLLLKRGVSYNAEYGRIRLLHVKCNALTTMAHFADVCAGMGMLSVQ